MKTWYLLYCKRGEQQRAKQHLENQGVVCFYPEIEVEKMRRGKRQMVKEPMFPSYMFIQFDFEVGPSFTTIRSTRGVADFIRFGIHPKTLSDMLIEELQTLKFNTASNMVSSLFQKGQSVRISSGRFSGIEAIYQEPDGEKRSIMLIEMLNKSVPISIDNTEFV